MDSIIKPLFDAGIQALLKQDRDNESGKSGVLRGGNSGIYIPQEELVAGKCARLSYLRYKGVSVEETEHSRKLMFTAGVSNEDQWYDSLIMVLPKEQILREEEIPVNWRTDNNVEVTGRPDFVILDADKKPKVGIELKHVSSVWTARDVMFEGRPKFEHLIQAAHYMWQLDIPFELWYTSRADFATNDMVNRCLPNYFSPRFKLLEEHLKMGYYKKVMSKNGKEYGKSVKKEEFEAAVQNNNYGYKPGEYYAAPIAVLPFSVGYTLWWSEETGRLWYKSTETGDTCETVITKQNIESYYNLVAYMDTTDMLPPRPTTFKGDGSLANYTACQYCPLEDTCTKAEKQKAGVQTWLKLVKTDLDNNKKDNKDND